MSYKKSADSNRDALFGGSGGGGPKHKKNAAVNRDALFGGMGSNSNSNSKNTAAAPTRVAEAPGPAASPSSSSNQGYKYQPSKKSAGASKPCLTGEARERKLKEAEEYREKANKCMQKSFFSKPDPVAASTYFKRAADAYQQAGDDGSGEINRFERMFRLESATCNRQCGAWSSAANDYLRVAQLTLEAVDITDLQQKRRDAAQHFKRAAAAWTEMGERAKAAKAEVDAAMALTYGDESTLLSKDALAGMEEAVEAHVPDVFNVYARYRQTGSSKFIGPNDKESVDNPSPQTRALAQEHMVTKAYAHEPLQELVTLLVHYGEYASALYAAGAATAVLEQDGVSTLSLSRAYLTETILTLAMGDPIQAEQQFLNRHLQKTFYLNSRECKLAEELYRAVKMRDIDALEQARDPVNGTNKAALANLSNDSMRQLVQQLRVSGVARKALPGEEIPRSRSNDKAGVAAAAAPAAPAAKEVPLQELLGKKTGYEKDVQEGDQLDPDALHDELENLDFGDGLDDSDNDGLGGGDKELDELEDDDIDLR